MITSWEVEFWPRSATFFLPFKIDYIGKIFFVKWLDKILRVCYCIGTLNRMDLILLLLVSGLTNMRRGEIPEAARWCLTPKDVRKWYLERWAEMLTI